MANLVQEFHLFGRSKVFVRSLVIYGLKNSGNENKSVSIERCHKIVGGYRQEATDMDYAIFQEGGTFHLHDLFLTDNFGITVKFLDGKSGFENLESKSAIKPHPLFMILSLKGEEILLLNYAEANIVV